MSHLVISILSLGESDYFANSSERMKQLCLERIYFDSRQLSTKGIVFKRDFFSTKTLV
jgi:hypothetical protein